MNKFPKQHLGHGYGPSPSNEKLGITVRQAPSNNQSIIEEIRRAVADYMFSEGCSCCQDIEKHKENRNKLGALLGVPEYTDGSGHNFSQFRSPKKDT